MLVLNNISILNLNTIIHTADHNNAVLNWIRIKVINKFNHQINVNEHLKNCKKLTVKNITSACVRRVV